MSKRAQPYQRGKAVKLGTTMRRHAAPAAGTGFHAQANPLVRGATHAGSIQLERSLGEMLWQCACSYCWVIANVLRPFSA